MKTYILFFAILAVVGLVYYFGFAKKDKAKPEESSQPVVEIESIESSSGLKKEVLVPGSGKAAEIGNTAVVHYTGILLDGAKFDSSLDRGQPFSFTLGSGQVIQGWEQGILGMQVGEKRKLTIPPELGYGSQAVGPIPANSTLVFEVELLEIK